MAPGTGQGQAGGQTQRHLGVRCVLYEPLHSRLENRQRHAAAAQDNVVEAAMVELWSKGAPRFVAQPLDRDHADLYAVAWPGVTM